MEKNDNTQVEEIWKRGKRSKRSYFRKAELSTARSKDNQIRNKGINTQNSEGNKKKRRKRRIDCCRIQNDHTCISEKNNYLHVESNELSSDDSILVTNSDDIQTYDHGEFSPVNPSLVLNMQGKYRDCCSKYCNSHSNLNATNNSSIEEYIKSSKIDRTGSWGTDLELFLAAQLLKTDIFLYKNFDHLWYKFSGHGFNDKKYVHNLTEKRIYLRLYLSHFQPVTKVNSEDKVGQSNMGI